MLAKHSLDHKQVLSLALKCQHLWQKSIKCLLPLLNQKECLPCNGQLWKPLCGIMQAALIERSISVLEIIKGKQLAWGRGKKNSPPIRTSAWNKYLGSKLLSLPSEFRSVALTSFPAEKYGMFGGCSNKGTGSGSMVEHMFGIEGRLRFNP